MSERTRIIRKSPSAFYQLQQRLHEHYQKGLDEGAAICEQQLAQQEQHWQQKAADAAGEGYHNGNADGYTRGYAKGHAAGKGEAQKNHDSPLFMEMLREEVWAMGLVLDAENLPEEVRSDIEYFMEVRRRNLHALGPDYIRPPFDCPPAPEVHIGGIHIGRARSVLHQDRIRAKD